MALNPEARHLFTTRLVPAIACLMLVYFGVHLLQGERSILSYISLNHSLNEMKTEEAAQKEKLDVLESRVVRLRPATFDKDFAEEQARTSAGLARTDEKVILLNQPAQ